jgi:hypothetical protein
MDIRTKLKLAIELLRIRDYADVADWIALRQSTELALPGKQVTARPTVVCLYGSMSFTEAFRSVYLSESIAGRIVLPINFDFESREALSISSEERAALDNLYFKKIDLSDDLYVLNVAGFVSQTTARFIHYAKANNKLVRFLESNSHV